MTETPLVQTLNTCGLGELPVKILTSPGISKIDQFKIYALAAEP